MVNSLCSGLVSNHASWYRFRCYQAGTLGFTITPLGPNDDYDWADLARDFLFQVYNRFGQLVFSTRVPMSGWDGTFKGIAASAGTYVWQLSYTHPTGGQKVYEKGTSILIR